MNTHLMVNKLESRAYLKNKLDSFIVAESKARIDQLICENLVSLMAQLYPSGGQLYGAYQAMAEEPLLTLPAHWNVSYPVVESDTQMNFYTSPNDEFTSSKLGVKEPKKTAENFKDKQSHDAFIIPAVGFNHSGHRLGHGGGYYDRYLSKINKIKIGVGYSVQLTDGLWVPEEHDIQLNYIVTEKYVVKVNS